MSAFQRAASTLAAACALSILAGSKLAAADTAACVNAANSATASKKTGALLAARENLLACAKSECPDAIRRDCEEQLGEIRRRIPSVVLAAETPRGELVEIVRVTLSNGTILASSITGKPIELDAGKYELVFESRSGRTTTSSVVVLEGQKDRVVRAIFPAEKAQEKSESRRPAGPGPEAGVPPATAKTHESEPLPKSNVKGSNPAGTGSTQRIAGLAIGGGGVVAAAVGAIFWVQTAALPGPLNGVCQVSNCIYDDLRASRTTTWATVTIVGGVAAVTGVILWATAPRSDSQMSVSLAPNGFTIRGSF